MTQSPHLVLIVAAAGFGKSTALDAARPRDGLVVPAREALDGGLPARGWIGLDDLHELTLAEQLRLAAEVSSQPGETEVVLTSRRPLPAEVRRTLRGPVRERGPADLALSPYAVHRVLVDEYGVLDPEVPLDVHALTAGWPTLVHFAADALARNGEVDLAAELTGETTPAGYWLRDEVFPTMTEPAQLLLACLSGLGSVTRAVCRKVAESFGPAEREWSTTDLEATGILTRLHGIGREGLLRPVPVVARALARAAEKPASDASLVTASTALEEDGLPYGAAVASVEAGDWPNAFRLLAARGDEMVRHGQAPGVIRLVESAPDVLSDGVRQTYADALRISGDLSSATRAFQPLVEPADDAPGRGWSPALASRVASVDYAAGRFELALERLASAEPAGADPVETVDWTALRVHALCSLGRADEAAPAAISALDLAERSGDERALTAAHLAMARVTGGGRKEAHHEFALRAATRCGDVITSARILVNHSFQLLATARYDEATRAARGALEASDVGVPAGRRASAMHNLAEALMQQGEYDEATWHLDRAVALCRRLGVGRIALGLLGLAEIHQRQGHDERARTRYLEAAELSRESGEPQVLVPALAGLARVDALSTDDPELGLERAQEAADEAMDVATASTRPFALTAAGWVALRRDDREAAADLARQSVAAARELQAFDLLADALELAAACTDDSRAARPLLTEALSIWEAGGARPPACRIELQLGRLEDADSAGRSRARDAVRELQRLGVRHVNGLPLSTTGAMSDVVVEVLGGFRVSVGGAEVPVPAWRSRQARTLVKILSARRGRPSTRAWLCETLWPDDDPAKTGHRLSVLLATVRGVLDPERRWPTDRFIAADPHGVWLDLRHVALDAETLIRDAEVAADLMDSGEHERAAEILTDINTRCRGEAFEDEPAEDWADGLREEVRAAWQRSVRRLAALARRAGRVGDAQTLLVRLLVADPYDEKIHALLVKSLVGAGRRGEARRAFERWTAAMRDIGAPPPDAGALEPPASGSRGARRSTPNRPVRLGPVVTSY